MQIILPHGYKVLMHRFYKTSAKWERYLRKKRNIMVIGKEWEKLKRKLIYRHLKNFDIMGKLTQNEL